MLFFQHLFDALGHLPESGGLEVHHRFADVLGAFLWIALLLAVAARALVLAELLGHLAEVFAAIALITGTLLLGTAGTTLRRTGRGRGIRILRAQGHAGSKREDGYEEARFHECIETHRLRIVAKRIRLQSSSLSWMWRYSICPRSPSRPTGPVAGSLSASSSTSPLHSQCATLSFTVTMMVFQSCGLYFFSSL